MKEATGELNMTVITVIAIAAVAGLFYAFVWPMVQKNIVQRTCDSYGTGYVATKNPKSTSGCVDTEAGTAAGFDDPANKNEKTTWYCCPK